MSDLLSLIPATGVPRLVFDAVWQSTLIGGTAWLLLKFLVRQPAARSWLAVLACVLCLVAPGISATARIFGLGLLSKEPATVETQTPNRETAETEPQELPDTTVPDAVDESYAAIAAIDVPFVAATETVDTVAAQPVTNSTQSPSRTIHPGYATQSFALSVPSMWSMFCFGWSIVAFVFLFRLGKSAIVLWRICRDADECEDPLLLKSSKTAASLLKLSHVPRVYVSGRTSCPAVISWIHARLIVPPVKEVRSGDHWVSVFAHELAHVQRRDTWARLITEFGIIVMPWQPLLWLLRREYQQASEEACDDWAVYAGADPFDYASCLTEWIPRQQPTLALGIAGWPQMVRRRIERLLEDRSLSRPGMTVAGMTGTTIVAATVLLLVALTQQGQLFSATWNPDNSLVAVSASSNVSEVVAAKADRTDVPPAAQKTAADAYPVVKVA